MAGVYAFPFLQCLEARSRAIAKSTECRIRNTIDMYDIVYASIDNKDILAKLEGDFKKDIEGPESPRMRYEYLMDLDDEHANRDSNIDDARNEIETWDASIHRRLLFFARINHVITEETVKEYFGRFRASWDVDPLKKGGENDRRFE